MLDIRIDEKFGRDYQVCLVERPDIPTAKQKVEQIDVPGRHGSLTKKGAFEDVTFTVQFNLLEDQNIKPLVRKIKSWLIRARILSFTDDDVYRKVKHVEIGDIANEIEEYGMFDVTFTTDPFEYAICQPIELNQPGTIVNYGTWEALPKLTVYGTGIITITIHDVSFQIKNLTNHVIVDSELKEAYAGTTPMNDKMVGKFPYFEVGENTISWTGKLTKLVIEPRWCYI
ncbi:phage tail family protein [Bacillus cereus]|nr:phage tail family protein [Bacillus cereus]MEB9569682.1 phage tail family protein [Bacillus cereus]